MPQASYVSQALIPKGYIELYHMCVGPLEILLKQKILNIQSRRKKNNISHSKKGQPE